MTITEDMLTYKNGVDQDNFILYVLTKNNSQDFIFESELLRRIVAYGVKNNNVSLNQLAYFLYDIIPELEMREVFAFCDNSILTKNAILEKEAFWQECKE